MKGYLMTIQNSQVDLYSKTETILKQTKVETEEHFYKNVANTSVINEYRLVEIPKIEESNPLMIQDYRALYDDEDHLSFEDKMKKMIIELLLEQFTSNLENISIQPTQTSNIIIPNSNISEEKSSTFTVNPYMKTRPLEMELQASLYKINEEYHQKQSIDFSSSVTIQTPDQSYSMDLEISFSKELYESKSSQIIIGDESFIDPLIINYDENVNPFDNISNLHFEFDLDNDGSTEMIPQLKNGAGYLALDKNENGIIDNGSELFGPNTNDGFQELSQYDTDNNNWIDENDAVFDKLKVWSIDEHGKSSLVSLIDSNVGAIYLGEIQSGFKYQSAIDKTDAVQKSNGIFVKEDGSGLGIVNSIDIVV